MTAAPSICLVTATAIGSCAALIPSLALAGGTASPVRIDSVTRDARTYSVTLTVLEPPSASGNPFGSCQRAVVQGSYADRLEGEPRWSRTGLPAPRPAHQSALAILERAAQSKQPILFGSMGYGLATTSVRCNFRSIQLRSIDGAIYSFFHQV